MVWGSSQKTINAVNAFGNLLIQDKDDRFWRICPEELICELVAEDEELFEKLLLDSEFLSDWEMVRFVQVANQNLGTLEAGSCYCLKLPAVVGGTYNPDNFGKVSIVELIETSGKVAQQIQTLPDGAQIQFDITG